MANASVLETDDNSLEGSSPSFRTKHDMNDKRLQYWASHLANMITYGHTLNVDAATVTKIVFQPLNFTQHDIEEIKQRANVILWFKDANNR